MNDSKQIEELIDTISGWVWGSVMLCFLVGTGVFLTLRLKGLQFSMLVYALKQAFFPHKDKDANGKPHKGDVSQFGALMTALSATIGTGNIAGVATAVVSGGPGAVFWMWMAAVFGMATKFAEGLLAVKYRVSTPTGEMSGGPMYFIERGLGNKWKWLALAFAFFGTVASFGIGSSVQSNSVAQVVQKSFGIAPIYTGIALTALTAVVVLGGIRSITKASSFIVPVMAILYVLGCLCIIVMHAHLLLPAVKLILSDAFTGQAMAGGSIGTVVRYGVARGVFSNEAGMGSGSIAAAAAKTDHSVRQALVSMTGTFLDTVIVCSMTGIVLVMGTISSGKGFVAPTLKGAELTAATFEQMLSGAGGWIVSIGLIFFAYSTILGWCYYGEKCAAYLFGNGFVKVYRAVYVATVMAGPVVSDLDVVWKVADTFNGLMAIPNLIALVLLSSVIVQETKDFKQKRKTGELP